MTVSRFDHVAVPIERVDAMAAFYRRLGFRVEEHPPRYMSVHFGPNKINMHMPALWRSGEFDLRGPTAEPGCGEIPGDDSVLLAAAQARLTELKTAAAAGHAWPLRGVDLDPVIADIAGRLPSPV